MAARKKSKSKGAGTGAVSVRGGVVEDVVIDGESFMQGQAEDDREATQASHIDKALKACKEAVSHLAKAVAYAISEHELERKVDVMTAIADAAAEITTDARRAVRNAKAENRNLQPS